MANIVTVSRILCSILLLFSPAFSLRFNVLYLICGLSDMIDGTIARKTNSASEFGAALDTAADFIFVISCMVKLLPEIDIPGWLYLWIAVIATIKTLNIASGFIYNKKLAAEHTVPNKITGFLLFLLPLSLNIVRIEYSAAAVCCVATFAALHEGHHIRTRR